MSGVLRSTHARAVTHSQLVDIQRRGEEVKYCEQDILASDAHSVAHADAPSRVDMACGVADQLRFATGLHRYEPRLSSSTIGDVAGCPRSLIPTRRMLRQCPKPAQVDRGTHTRSQCRRSRPRLQQTSGAPLMDRKSEFAFHRCQAQGRTAIPLVTVASALRSIGLTRSIYSQRDTLDGSTSRHEAISDFMQFHGSSRTCIWLSVPPHEHQQGVNDEWILERGRLQVRQDWSISGTTGVE